MSQENVDAVEVGMAAVTGGDVAALVELSDPVVEFDSFLARVSGGDGAYRGHEGLRRYVRDLAEAWEWFRPEVSECRDLGDRVLMTGLGKIQRAGDRATRRLASHLPRRHRPR